MNDIWVQRRVLVTGGGGFLGRVIRRKLDERGKTIDWYRAHRDEPELAVP